MKAIIEYLRELNEPERSQAIANYQIFKKEISLQCEFDFAVDNETNMRMALTFAFQWDKTKEGADYWLKIANKYDRY